MGGLVKPDAQYPVQMAGNGKINVTCYIELISLISIIYMVWLPKFAKKFSGETDRKWEGPNLRFGPFSAADYECGIDEGNFVQIGWWILWVRRGGGRK